MPKHFISSFNWHSKIYIDGAIKCALKCYMFNILTTKSRLCNWRPKIVKSAPKVFEKHEKQSTFFVSWRLKLSHLIFTTFKMISIKTYKSPRLIYEWHIDKNKYLWLFTLQVKTISYLRQVRKGQYCLTTTCYLCTNQ